MNWLEKLSPPKLYRYVFYRLSIISAKLGNTQPYFSTMILMSITILFQFFFVILSIGVIVGINIWLEFFTGAHIFSIISFMLIFLYFNFLLFNYKGKWRRFMTEFENEDFSQKKKKGFLVLLYIIGSFALFYLCLWLLTFNNPNYQH